MSIDLLRNYNSLFVDYSIVFDTGNSSFFYSFLEIVSENNIKVYVSSNFKLYHYAAIHQSDTKTSYISKSMKEFCATLLAKQNLLSVHAESVIDYLNKVQAVESGAILCSDNSIFLKRLLETRPYFNNGIFVINNVELLFFSDSEDFYSRYKCREISKLAFSDKFLNEPVYCNIGDKVITEKGYSIELTRRLSQGAEGMVFETDNSRYVAKIYHRGVITPLRWSKLTKMVSIGLNSIGICWPISLLFFRETPVGYLMIKGNGNTLGSIFDGPDAMVNAFPSWTRLDIVNTLVDLLEKYVYLHLNDIVAGDIQLRNVLVHSSSSVYLIDMDSTQVSNMPCPVGTEEFSDPELWGTNFGFALRTMESEDYSISILVFSMLFCGLHPYASRHGADTLQEEIINKNFPYTIDDSSEEHIPLGGYNFIWKYLPDYLREMLYRAFKEGKRYETITWYEALVNYKNELTAHQYDDPEAYKIFPKMDYKPASPDEYTMIITDGKSTEKITINKSDSSLSMNNKNTGTKDTKPKPSGGFFGRFLK